MKRTTFTLLTLVAATAIWAGTAQAAPTVSVTAGLVSQTLARSRHHDDRRHHDVRRHHGRHHYAAPYRHGHHPRPMHVYRPPVYVPYRPIYVAPPIYHGGCGYGHGGFYINGRNFSFGIDY